MSNGYTGFCFLSKGLCFYFCYALPLSIEVRRELFLSYLLLSCSNGLEERDILGKRDVVVWLRFVCLEYLDFKAVNDKAVDRGGWNEVDREGWRE